MKKMAENAGSTVMKAIPRIENNIPKSNLLTKHPNKTPVISGWVESSSAKFSLVTITVDEQSLFKEVLLQERPLRELETSDNPTDER